MESNQPEFIYYFIDEIGKGTFSIIYKMPNNPQKVVKLFINGT